MDFFETIMFPFKWLVSIIMVGFHEGLTAIGLPAAATASWDQLLADYNAALETTMKRLGGRLPRAASAVSRETTQEGTPRA